MFFITSEPGKQWHLTKSSHAQRSTLNVANAIKYGQDDAIFELEAAELGYSLLTGNSPAEASTRVLG